MSKEPTASSGNRWAECVGCGTKIVLTDYLLELEGIDSKDLFVGAVLPLQLGCKKCRSVAIAEYRVTSLNEQTS